MTNIFFWQHASWTKAYMAAMLEDSQIELPRRIAKANAEIGARLAELLGQKHSMARTLELNSLDDAISDLSLLVKQEPTQRLRVDPGQIHGRMRRTHSH